MAHKLIMANKAVSGILALLGFFVPYALLVAAPPHILQLFHRHHLPVAGGVAVVALASITLSLLASAIWNAWVRPHARFTDALFGITIIVVGLVTLDGVRAAVTAFPVRAEDEQLVHAVLVLWVALTAFATKTPWDDLRDKLSAVLRGWLDHLTDPG